MNELQNQLEVLREREGELKAALATKRREVQAARAGLVSGAASPSNVATAQGEEQALVAALALIGEQITVASTQLDQARADEVRAARIARGIELAREAAAEFAEHEAAYREACALLDARATRMLDARERLRALKSEFAPLDLDLPMGAEAARVGVDLAAVRFDWRYYRWGEDVPLARHGVIHAFEWMANESERQREGRRPLPAIPDSWDLGYKVVPDNDPPRGTPRPDFGPTTIRREDIGR